MRWARQVVQWVYGEPVTHVLPAVQWPIILAELPPRAE
jgi:hypothetical protein